MRELRARAGLPGAFFAKPFEFRAAESDENAPPEWDSIEQLEAVVEFYVNFRPNPPRFVPDPPGPDNRGDPWEQDAQLLDSNGSESKYVRVNLGRIEGTCARATAAEGGLEIQLDGDHELSDIIINPENIAQNVAQGTATFRNPWVAAGGPAEDPASYPERRRFLYDMIELDEGARRSKLYRIMGVNESARTVTLDASPNLGDKSSKWKIIRRPIIVIIDPLGARQNSHGQATVWRGDVATVVATVGDPPLTTLQLDGTQPLGRINARHDTIYLPRDTASHVPARTYRIVGVDAGNRLVTVEGEPRIDAGSPWHIPAGIGGTLQSLPYNFQPAAAPRGHDHFDGALFIVYDGKVKHHFRWTSFTSRRSPLANPQDHSSLRGNGRYYYSSYLSGKSVINFSFAVIDAHCVTGITSVRPLPRHRLVNDIDQQPPPARAGDPNRPWDVAHYARFYHGTVDDGTSIEPDENGKREIRLHMAHDGVTLAGNGTGSAGCLVSPLFPQMRRAMLAILVQEYRAFYGGGQDDPDVAPVTPLFAPPNPTHADAVALYTALYPANAGTQQQQQQQQQQRDTTRRRWDDKMAGHLWLIRPDEPPLTPPG